MNYDYYVDDEDDFFDNYEREVNPYSPDFIFIHQRINLHIDIEIDEPYLLRDKQIIHASDQSKDLDRNTYFLEKGWFIVRFAEEQIIKMPKACCRLIAELIYEYTSDNTYINRIEKNGELQPVKKWKINDIEMVQNRYREKYLESFKQRLNGNNKLKN